MLLRNYGTFGYRSLLFNCGGSVWPISYKARSISIERSGITRGENFGLPGDGLPGDGLPGDGLPGDGLPGEIRTPNLLIRSY